MSAEIHQFPKFIVPLDRRTGGIPRPRREYDFADMVRLLALHSLSVRTQIARLRLLAEQASLPLPKSVRVWSGRVVPGALAICQQSLWCALQVDAWVDMQGQPPPAASAMPPPRRLGAVDRDAMRQRAASLGGRA